MGGGEAVAVAEDGLEVGVEAVVGGEDDGLVDGHGKDDWLGKEDTKGSIHAGEEFGREGSVVFVGDFVVAAVGLFAFSPAVFEEHGGVGFPEEEEPGDGIGGADNGENPEHPAPR